jgi:DNA helicase-2/ATP-dependent DNA helicase PcrA
MAMRRIINTPPRGIGDQTQDALESFIFEHANNSIYEGLRQVSIDGQGTFTTRNRKAIRDFFETLRRWREILPTSPPSLILKAILRDTSYLDYLAKRDPERATETSENVRELITALEDFEHSHPDPSLLQFLEDSLLNALPDTEPSLPSPNDPPPIQLMTIHSAKGLEFDAVFVSGFEQLLMPLQRPGDPPDNLEEERRLAYVAFTRARRALTLTSTQMRRIYGQTRYPNPSTFLSELDPNDLNIISPNTPISRAFSPKPPSPSPKIPPSPQKSSPFTPQKSSPFTPPKPPSPPSSQPSPKPRFLESRSDLSPGDSVNHARFGSGQVLSLEPRAGQIIATVDFPLAGIKKVVTSFLQKL